MPKPVSIEFSARSGQAHLPWLRRKFLELHSITPHAPAHVSVALVGDRVMDRLHREFMNISGPTDVLTFPLDFDPRGRCTAGEIVVCPPEARRRIERVGYSVRTSHLREEILLYMLHGLLHLTGLDDIDPSDYHHMHRTEDRLLRRIGVGPVFARKAGHASSTARRTSGESP